MSRNLEHRRHHRVGASLSVRISTIEPERDPWTGRPFFRALEETCANVSRGGAFVRTSEPLDPGRRILLELGIPNGGPVEAIGRVAWTKRVIAPRGEDSESGIGIEFIGGASEQFAALEDFIACQEAEQRGPHAGRRSTPRAASPSSTRQGPKAS